MPEPVQIIRNSWSVGKCSLQGCWARGIKKTKLVATHKKFCWRHHDLVNPCNVAVSRIVSDVFCQWWAISILPNSRTCASSCIAFVQAYGHGGQSLLTEKCLLSADAWIHPLFWGLCLLNILICHSFGFMSTMTTTTHVYCYFVHCLFVEDFRSCVHSTFDGFLIYFKQIILASQINSNHFQIEQILPIPRHLFGFESMFI